MTRVTVESVTKAFGSDVAVDDVSLTVRDGEILGLVGPSGCGKTTTLRTIAGFEAPTQGRVCFGDTDVTAVPPDERNVGLLFQSNALFDNMSVVENVAFGLRMQGVPEPDRHERARTLLDMLDIADLADRDPRRLSGGQQQRVELARALAPEPRVLLLDEPMTGLDAKLKRQLRPELGALLDDLGVTTLYVTHDQREAMATCDRIAVMNDGRIEQVGAPETIYERPANEFVASFIGTTNLLDAAAEGEALDLGFATLDRLPEGTTDPTVVARPEAFTVGTGDIEATVSDVFYFGERREAIVETDDGTTLTVRPDDTSLAADERVHLAVDTDRLHVIDS
ncbi:ABC transporter ATP-binding protein [Haloplanus halophilus]|uniref:ABC transporter ATP-binding protein n=1 Tax=Haloplanus halophilus TaxID=2949993 RepID=UPI00203B7D2E|nr:ABC transporter ATP-binding protein [Haloplanus sp. GDY1]